MNTKYIILALLAAAIGTNCAGTLTKAPSPVQPDARPAVTERSLPAYIRGNKQSRARRAIIFVHGIFGDGTTTWTNATTNTYFPDLVAADPTFAEDDIWVHEFDTPKLRTTYTIDELADHLRKHLNNDNVIANHDEIIFLCHSMGGLVARAYLLKYHREVTPDKVRMMYFFSTPTTGSDIASLARLVSSNPTLTDMRKMTTDDSGVLGLWEAQWSSSMYAQHVLSYCAYELLTTYGIQVVERESARHLCNTRPDPIARNHIDIVKPSNGYNDDSYIAFREAYRDTYERSSDPSAVARPTWNLLSTDAALLRISNVTQNPYCGTECWSPSAMVAPGDTVNFAISYSNRGLTTAKDVRVRLDIPAFPLVVNPIYGTVTSQGTQAAFGLVGLRAITPVLLRPMKAWLQDSDGTTSRDLPYQQNAHSVITKDGVGLGDLSPGAEPHCLVVQFRCEPVSLIAIDLDAVEGQVTSLLKKMQDGALTETEMLNPLTTPAGHIDTGDWKEYVRWSPQVSDVHDGSNIMLTLLHFNNTSDVQQRIRAGIRVYDQTDAGATIHIALRSAASDETREFTARLNFRPGTKGRPSLVDARFVPKNMFKGIQALARGEIDSMEEPELVPTSSPNELDIGDLPPQTAVMIAMEYAMLEPSEAEPFEQFHPSKTTTLNAKPDGPPLVHVTDREGPTRWRKHLTNFPDGDPLMISMYYHNTGHAIAHGVHVRLSLERARGGFIARSTMTATNAPQVTGESRIDVARPPSRLHFYYRHALIYRNDDDDGRFVDATSALSEGFFIGDLDPDEWGWLVLRFDSSGLPGTACTSQNIEAGKQFTMGITLDNDTGKILQDVRVHLDADYRGSVVILTVTATAAGKVVFTEQRHGLRSEGAGEFRYREATLHKSMFGAPFDAYHATIDGVSVGDIAAGGQAYLHIRYDVMHAD